MGVNLFAALVLLLIVLGVALKRREEPLTDEEENPTTDEADLRKNRIHRNLWICVISKKKYFRPPLVICIFGFHRARLD